MANDFKQKEPTKTEKVLYEMMMRQEMLDRSLWTTSAHVIALGMLLNIEPEKVAETLVGGQDKIKEYGNKINEAISKLEKEKKSKDGNDHSHDHAGHDHSSVEEKAE